MPLEIRPLVFLLTRKVIVVVLNIRITVLTFHSVTFLQNLSLEITRCCRSGFLHILFACHFMLFLSAMVWCKIPCFWVDWLFCPTEIFFSIVQTIVQKLILRGAIDPSISFHSIAGHCARAAPLTNLPARGRLFKWCCKGKDLRSSVSHISD